MSRRDNCPILRLILGGYNLLVTELQGCKQQLILILKWERIKKRQNVDMVDGQGDSLIYTDTVGLATQLTVAPGTVISGTNVSYLPLPAVDPPLPCSPLP